MSPVQTEVLVAKPLREGLCRDVAGQAKCRVVVVVIAPEDFVSIAEGVIDTTDKLGLVEFVVGAGGWPIEDVTE